MSSSTPAATDDEPVEMSVFNVTGEQDEGYTALNTTSGSRVRTPLKDVAAAISPFTSDFLDDLGASTIDDIMAYAGNAETDADDSTNGFQDVSSRGPGVADERFRLRGLPMSRVVDYFPYPASINLYNIDHAEIASGPNSILYGFGAQGGIVNLVSKRPNPNRNHLKIRDTIGTWTSPAVSGIPYQSLWLDYNLVLIRRTLAFRLMGLWQDGGGGSWRSNMFMHDRRINPAIYIKPFKNTIINARYETGRIKQSTSYSWNVSDQLSAWLALDPADRVMQGFGSAYALPSIDINGNLIAPTTQNTYNSGGNRPHLTYINNPGATDALYDLRQTYRSTNMFAGNPNNYRLSSDVNSYYNNPVGPGGLRDLKFDYFSVNIEQRIGSNLNLELAYTHGSSNASAHSPQGNDAGLRGDPNSLISASFNVTNNSNTLNLMPNPFAGGIYVEDYWWLKTNRARNDVARLTADYGFNFRKAGRHRLIGFYEHSEYEQYSNTLHEVLIDENQNLFVAYSADPVANVSSSNPTTDTSNDLYRRNYVTLGDYSTYYPGDWRDPVTPGFFNGHTWRTGYATFGQKPKSHYTRSGDSAMLVLQSYWLRNKLVTTLGARLDWVSYNIENTSQVTDPADPRIRNRSLVIGEYDLDGTYKKQLAYRPLTWSGGIVYHLTDRFSLFYNHATNRALPGAGGTTVLPDGNPPPLTEGRTDDFGVLIDPLDTGKLTIRLTYFDTSMRHNASINPVSGDSIDSNTLGSTNLQNINSALKAAYGIALADPIADAQVVLPGFSAPLPNYTSGMFDTRSSGYELVITANFTKNFTLRIAGSYNQRDKQNILNEIITYYNKNIPAFFDLVDNAPGQTANRDKTVSLVTDTGAPWTGNLYDFVRAQLYQPGTLAGQYGSNQSDTSVRQGIYEQLFQQSGALGARPWQFNAFARYQIRRGALKGFAFSGGVRYQSQNYMPNPKDVQQALDTIPTDGTLGLDSGMFNGNRGMMRGNSLLFWDAMARYRLKILGGRTTLTLQLDVRNLFNQGVITGGRLSADSRLTRVYLSTPRTLRLSATLDF